MRVSLATVALWLFANCTAAVAEPDFSAIEIRPITTTILYANGEEHQNRGTGFVIGKHFYTVYHNLQAAPAVVAQRTIELGGIAVEPAAIDVEHDLAVFRIPEALCSQWCNSVDFGAPIPLATETVTWLRLGKHGHTWKRARVSNLAFKSVLGANATGGCEDNLIVEVDAPFLPGSSGGPVFDAASGRIVGLIQGSFESSGGRTTGYYKPVRCVLSRLTQAESNLI